MLSLEPTHLHSPVKYNFTTAITCNSNNQLSILLSLLVFAIQPNDTVEMSNCYMLQPKMCEEELIDVMGNLSKYGAVN